MIVKNHEKSTTHCPKPESENFSEAFKANKRKRKSTKPSTTHLRWTTAEDEKIKQAILNAGVTNPFQKIYYQDIKKFHLPDLPKNNKQISMRWKTYVNPWIKSHYILEEDKEMVISLIHEKGPKWVEISKLTYELFNKRCYYPDNAIKNFYHNRSSRENFPISLTETNNRASLSPPTSTKVSEIKPKNPPGSPLQTSSSRETFPNCSSFSCLSEHEIEKIALSIAVREIEMRY